MAITNTTPTIVTLFEISFANDEIVCLKDGRHFLPSEVHIVENSIQRGRIMRELKLMDRMIEALEAADKEPAKIKINRQDVVFANQHIVATKDNAFTPDEVEIVEDRILG